MLLMPLQKCPFRVLKAWVLASKNVLFASLKGPFCISGA